MAVKINVVESYRIDSEDEVDSFINKVKEEANFTCDICSIRGYELKSYSSNKKVKKAKGEVVDEAYLVKVEKAYSNFWMDGAF